MTAGKWVQGYELEGLEALKERLRRPHEYPWGTSREGAQRVVEMKLRYLGLSRIRSAPDPACGRAWKAHWQVDAQHPLVRRRSRPYLKRHGRVERARIPLKGTAMIHVEPNRPTRPGRVWIAFQPNGYRCGCEG